MADSRLTVLCEQTKLTGIDFVQVVEPFVQTVLRAFFVVEPSALTPAAMVDGALLAPPGPGQTAGPLLPDASLQVTIVSSDSGQPVTVTGVGWRLVSAPAGLREALEISVAAPGDFGLYVLTITSPLIDPFFNGRLFSFKQGCPSLFDCDVDCTPDPIDGVDYPVDYLARDFESFRTALLAFAAARYPRWETAIVADQAAMLMEIMAALGDEFAYLQDRIARELTLETATQRRSRLALASLVDYQPDPGCAATAELAVTVGTLVDGAFPPLGARAWAFPEGGTPICYSVLQPGTQVWHHRDWNSLTVYQPDGGVACLPKGATDCYLVGDAPTAAQLPAGSTIPPLAFWNGRRAMLRSTPDKPGEPARVHAITIRSVSPLVDQLLPIGGPPTQLIHLTWQEPTPWPLQLANGQTVALLNIVPVSAGEQLVEYFRTGTDDELLQRWPALTPADQAAMLALPQTTERQGIYDPASKERGAVLRYGLLGSEAAGLGWQGVRDPLGLGDDGARQPMLTLCEVSAPTLASGDPWSFVSDILLSDEDHKDFSLEPGMWRTVVTYQGPLGDTFAFRDYAGDQGWTIRFGDGGFGREPEAGTIFRATYFTAEGSAANLAADSVVHLDPPQGAPAGVNFDYAEAITNPLPITSGVDEESAADVRINAPEAWRARPLRAVRPEDYASIVERKAWVQRANAVTAWTGSWSTDFVAADPLGGVVYTDDERADLEHIVDCMRLATRDARVADPDYLDIDLDVEVCCAADAYPGEVTPRVIAALADPGFFNPDNFTFGQPLYRSAVEAAVQAVPGVMGVERLRVRVRRHRDWTDFDSSSVAVGPNQIIRLQNDPQHPSRGSLHVAGHGGAG
jgi:hypothetical protein